MPSPGQLESTILHYGALPADAPASPTPLDPPVGNGVAPRRPDPFEDRITAFRLRAEKVMIRLQKIEAGAPPHEPTEVVRVSN